MTEVAKTNVITEPSLITAKRLTAHKIIVKDTGEVIRMTNDHRMVYSHLEDQFRGLTNPENIAAGKSTGHYYDSDKNLEIRCDVKNTTFKKVKKDLKALGLIHWEKPKARKSGHSCEYFVKPVDEVAPNLEFIFQELPNGKPSYDHERVSGQKAKKSNQQRSKPEPEETAGRVIASLDDLRHWSYVGDDGKDDYGSIWGLSGDGLDNLIREHLKIREAEAEKNFKSQRAH